MYRNILVPLDGSTLAEQVLPHVHTLATDTQATKITLLRAIPPVITPAVDYTGVFTAASDPLALLEEEARAYLEDIAVTFRHKGYQVELMVTTLPAAEAIIEYAQDLHCDLIVIATHGRSGISRWVFGSVTQKVVQAAPVPVLVIRPRPEVTLSEVETKAEVTQV